MTDQPAPPGLFGIRRSKPHHRATTDPYTDPSAVDPFIAAMTRLRDDWSGLDINQRLDRIDALINPRLAEAGVPPAVIEIDNNPNRGGGDGGSFDFQNWTIQLGPDVIRAPHLDVAATAQLADLVAHEGRHAQQWYDIARTLAGAGHTARQIEAATGIKDKVAMKATKDPLSANATGIEGNRRNDALDYHRSVYGSGQAHRRRTLTQLRELPAEVIRTHQAHHHALTTYGPNHPTTLAADQDRPHATQRYRQQYPSVEHDYRALPEEIDAWRVGGDDRQRSHRHQAQHPPPAPTLTTSHATSASNPHTATRPAPTTPRAPPATTSRSRTPGVPPHRTNHRTGRRGMPPGPPRAPRQQPGFGR
jgi:hypothetical protein